MQAKRGDIFYIEFKEHENIKKFIDMLIGLETLLKYIYITCTGYDNRSNKEKKFTDDFTTKNKEACDNFNIDAFSLQGYGDFIMLATRMDS